METQRKLLDELSSGEDEFDVDLMACGCRLIATTVGKKDKVTLQHYLRDVPGLGEAGLRRLVELLVEEHKISDQAFVTAVDRVVASGRKLPEL